jgi:hypothetical protein
VDVWGLSSDQRCEFREFVFSSLLNLTGTEWLHWLLVLRISVNSLNVPHIFITIGFRTFVCYTFSIRIESENIFLSYETLSIRVRGCIQKFPDWVDNETTTNTRWEATRSVMATKLTTLTHKIAIQLHLVAESCTISSSRSKRPVRKLLDTPSYGLYGFHLGAHFWSWSWLLSQSRWVAAV